MFLGTPHRGLEFMRVIRSYGLIFEMLGLATVSPMINDLKLGSGYLQDLSTRFRQVLKRYPTELFSFHETRRSKLLRRLVILSCFHLRVQLLSVTRSLINQRRLSAGLRNSSYHWKQIIELLVGSTVRMMSTGCAS